MLDGVLQQLGDRHRQGRGDIRTERTALALPLDVHPLRAERRGKVTDQTENPIDDLGECDVTGPSRRQEIVHDRDRPDAHFRFNEDVLRLIPRSTPALQAKQRRNRLQVVLHPMVDLLDGGVLTEQLTIAPSGFGHVTQEHHGSIAEWNRTHEDGDVFDVDIDAPGNLATCDVEDRSGDDSVPLQDAVHGIRQVHPDGILSEAEPAQCAHRIRTRILDGAGRGDPQQPITHPRGAGCLNDLIAWWECAVGKFLKQAIGDLEVHLLQSTRGAQAARWTTFDHCDHAPTCMHRIGLGTDALPRAGDVATHHRPSVGTGLLHERSTPPSLELTDDLIRHHGGGRGRPNVRGDDETRVIPRWQPQQQVTQRKIRDHIPLANQIVQEIAIRIVQIRSLQRCAIEESHGRSVRLHYGEPMTQIHGGGHVVDAAQAAGVRTLFTLSGAHIFPVYDAAVGGKERVEAAGSARDAERDGPLRLVDTRHEQTAAFAAEATGKLTRTPGFAAVTAGPGVTNAISAVTSAWFNGSPMVLMGGRSPDHRWGSGALQELDQPPILRPVTKDAWTMHDPAQIRTEADRAFALAASVHPGPVFFDIPMDVLFTPAERAPHAAATIDRGGDPDPDLLQVATTMVAAAQRPVVILGGDVWMGDAVDAARHFVEQRNLPTIANGMGRGVIPPSDGHLVSRARGAAFAQADLVIVVGTPLDFRLGYGVFGDPPVPVIHIIDSETNVSAAATCTVVGNIGRTLTALASGRPADASWVGSLRAVAEAAIAADQALLHSDADPIHPARIYGELLPRLTDDAIVIGDGGDFVSFAGRFIEPTRPGNWLDPGPYGCLGTGPGYALAAGIARPQSPHFLLLGDGAAGFSLMDVDALVRHDIPTVIIVGNNAGWALEKHPMRFLYGYDVIADLGATRYDEVVIALGGGGELVTNPRDIGPAIDRAMASGIPYCVNVMTDASVAYPRSTTGV